MASQSGGDPDVTADAGDVTEETAVDTNAASEPGDNVDTESAGDQAGDEADPEAADEAPLTDPDVLAADADVGVQDPANDAFAAQADALDATPVDAQDEGFAMGAGAASALPANMAPHSIAPSSHAGDRGNDKTIISQDDLDDMDAGELRALIRQMRSEHAQQLDAEARNRSELEDMMLRIEKHFKAEKAARTKAEELMEHAIESEESLKQQLQLAQSRFQEMDNDLQMDREKLQNERDQLEALRLDFESELQAAQTEVANAQDALKTAEDRVHAAEQIEKQKIVAEYDQRIMTMTSEMIRMREEMQQRTIYMTREMQRYQAAAFSTSQAMLAAKKEMQERRRDVDAMRVKMDGVMERLYSGHEHNLTLQANIATAQDHAGQLFSDSAFLQLMQGGMPMMLGAGGDPAGVVAPPPAQGTKRRQKNGRTMAQATSITELPPIQEPRQARSKLHHATTATLGKQNQAATARSKRAMNERFGGSKARNEYIMAAAMANW